MKTIYVHKGVHRRLLVIILSLSAAGAFRRNESIGRPKRRVNKRAPMH